MYMIFAHLDSEKETIPKVASFSPRLTLYLEGHFPLDR